VAVATGAEFEMGDLDFLDLAREFDRLLELAVLHLPPDA
jgi:hypothetical protein